jgi:ribosomal protein L29
MKLRDITSKTDQELNDFVDSERAALAKAIVESRTKEVRNVKALAAHKLTIARALTVARERQIAIEEAAE